MPRQLVDAIGLHDAKGRTGSEPSPTSDHARTGSARGPADAAVLLIAFLGQAIVGIFLLEYVNYIQHYGLRRTGKRKTKMHSWQSSVDGRGPS